MAEQHGCALLVRSEVQKMVFSNTVNGNTCVLQRQSVVSYAYKGSQVNDLFYTGVPYDFVFDIKFNSVHVGILYGS